MAPGRHGPSLPVHVSSGFTFWPRTRPGWWASGLAAASVLLVPSWRLMGPAGAAPGLSCALAGGVVALWAIVRSKERAVIVFASLVPFLFAVVLVLAELAIGHS